MRNLDNHQYLAVVFAIVVMATLLIIFMPPTTRSVPFRAGPMGFLLHFNNTLTWALAATPRTVAIEWYGGFLGVCENQTCTMQGQVSFHHVGHWIEFPSRYKIILK